MSKFIGGDAECAALLLSVEESITSARLVSKAAGAPCKVGERADETGCIPANPTHPFQVTTPVVSDDIATHGKIVAERARLNNLLGRFVDDPENPAALRLSYRMKELAKLDARLNVDPGGLKGIHMPGATKDLVIVGAGPGGLSAAISGSYDGLDALVVEANDVPGGQSKFSSRVENYPGYPIGVTGEELAQKSYEQAKRLGAETRMKTRVVSLSYDEDTGLKTLKFENGADVKARAVVLAGGIRFTKLGFPGEESPGVVYADAKKLAALAYGKSAVVIGGSNGAAQAALGVARTAKEVTLLARSPITKEMSDNQVQGLRHNPKIHIIEGDVVDHLVMGLNAAPQELVTKGGKHIHADAVGVFVGGGPDSTWLPPGIKREGRAVVVDNSTLETSIPGVFAVGDIRTGGLGRIGGAVGDGIHAAKSAWGYFKRVEDAAVKKGLSSGRRLNPNRTQANIVAFDHLIDRLWALEAEHPFLYQMVESDEDPEPLVYKSAGAPCKVGERADLTSCTPEGAPAVHHPHPHGLAAQALADAAKVHFAQMWTDPTGEAAEKSGDSFVLKASGPCKPGQNPGRDHCTPATHKPKPKPHGGQHQPHTPNKPAEEHLNRLREHMGVGEKPETEEALGEHGTAIAGHVAGGQLGRLGEHLAKPLGEIAGPIGGIVAGAVAEPLLHAVGGHHVITKIGAAVYDRLPSWGKKAVEAALKVDHAITRQAQHIMSYARELAREACKPPCPNHVVEKSSRILAAADKATSFVLTTGMAGFVDMIGGPVLGYVAGTAASFAAAKAVSYLPVASCAYIAWRFIATGVTEPQKCFQTMKRARERVKWLMANAEKRLKRLVWKAGKPAQPDQKALVAALMKKMTNIPPEKLDWYEALVCAAVDETKGDVAAAMDMADKLFMTDPDGGGGPTKKKEYIEKAPRLTDRQIQGLRRIYRSSDGTEPLSPDLARQLADKGLAVKYREWERGVTGQATYDRKVTLWVMALTEEGKKVIQEILGERKEWIEKEPCKPGQNPTRDRCTLVDQTAGGGGRNPKERIPSGDLAAWREANRDTPLGSPWHPPGQPKPPTATPWKPTPQQPMSRLKPPTAQPAPAGAKPEAQAQPIVVAPPPTAPKPGAAKPSAKPASGKKPLGPHQHTLDEVADKLKRGQGAAVLASPSGRMWKIRNGDDLREFLRDGGQVPGYHVANPPKAPHPMARLKPPTKPPAGKKPKPVTDPVALRHAIGKLKPENLNAIASKIRGDGGMVIETTPDGRQFKISSGDDLREFLLAGGTVPGYHIVQTKDFDEVVLKAIAS